MNLTKIISKDVKQCTATEQYGTTKHEKNIVTTIVTTMVNVTVKRFATEKEAKEFKKEIRAERDKGNLTSSSITIGEWVIEFLETYQKQKDSLVHAVTGAGKTEMIYKIVAYVLESKGNVAIASPRVDVCRELFLRMQRDFTCSISLLHAESEPYDGSPLVIATTHQLLKF